MVLRSAVPSEPKPYPKLTKSESLGVSPNMVGFGNLMVLMCGHYYLAGLCLCQIAWRV